LQPGTGTQRRRRRRRDLDEGSLRAGPDRKMNVNFLQCSGSGSIIISCHQINK